MKETTSVEHETKVESSELSCVVYYNKGCELSSRLSVVLTKSEVSFEMQCESCGNRFGKTNGSM